MKRVASVLALLGCLLHAILLPWHAANAKGGPVSDAAQLAQDLLVNCHGDGTGTSELGGIQREPSEQDGGCPICKGIPCIHLVVLAAAQAGLLGPPPAEQFSVASDAIGQDGFSVVPRSRGPPLPV